MSRVTQYVTLLNDCLFSTYNSITCVLRLMLSVLRGTDTVRHTVRTTRGLSPVLHNGPNDVSCLSREKEEELRLSTRYSDSRGMGL